MAVVAAVVGVGVLGVRGEIAGVSRAFEEEERGGRTGDGESITWSIVEYAYEKNN